MESRAGLGHVLGEELAKMIAVFCSLSNYFVKTKVLYERQLCFLDGLLNDIWGRSYSFPF